MVPKSSNHWDITWAKRDKPSSKRHRRSYNEELVIRGEFLLDVRIFKRWKRELKRVNKNKRGRPYLFPVVKGILLRKFGEDTSSRKPPNAHCRSRAKGVGIRRGGLLR
ncbi:hypothetical protein [Tardisphaera saccharovorans]